MFLILFNKSEFANTCKSFHNNKSFSSRSLHNVTLRFVRALLNFSATNILKISPIVLWKSIDFMLKWCSICMADDSHFSWNVREIEDRNRNMESVSSVILLPSSNLVTLKYMEYVPWKKTRKKEKNDKARFRNAFNFHHTYEGFIDFTDTSFLIRLH